MKTLFINHHVLILLNKMELLRGKNRHLVEVVRSILFQMKVPKIYWGKAILTTTQLINSKFSRHWFSSPKNIWVCFLCSCFFIGKQSKYIKSAWKRRIEVSFVHVHNHLRSKLDPKAFKCIFLGYSHTQKGYECYHPPTKKKYITMDVTFIENKPYFSKTDLQEESNKIMEDRW